MKNGEVWFLVILCFFVGAVMGWGISSVVYYNRGVSNTRLYYETTGQYPTADWVKASTHKTYQYPTQILDSLKEFTLTK